MPIAAMTFFSHSNRPRRARVHRAGSSDTSYAPVVAMHHVYLAITFTGVVTLVLAFLVALERAIE